MNAMIWKQFHLNPCGQCRGSRLMSRDSKLYIVTEYAMDEPGVIKAFWYPTEVRTRDYFDSFPKDGYASSSFREHYEVDTGHTGRPRPFRIALAEGGKTKAKYIEQRIVPPPKVRPTVELRWSAYRGVWEKMSKSTKWQWVPA